MSDDARAWSKPATQDVVSIAEEVFVAETVLTREPMMRRIQRIHFVGIGGSGMSGIAEVLSGLITPCPDLTSRRVRRLRD